LGGRAAEALVLGDISTGAISDLQKASETARNMVVKYGMSEEIGPIFLGSSQELFLGKEIGHTNNFSDELAFKVDEEVRRFLDEAYKKAAVILKEKEGLLHSITKVLIERERIDGEEFELLYNGKELPPLEEKKEEAPAEEEKPKAEAQAPVEPEKKATQAGLASEIKMPPQPKMPGEPPDSKDSES